MDHDLPDIQNTDNGSDDEGMGLVGWLVVGAGSLVGLYLVWQAIKWAFGIALWMLNIGLVALAVYVMYRFARWMMSGEDTSSSASASAGSHSLESSQSDDEYTLGDDLDEEFADLEASGSDEKVTLDDDLGSSDLDDLGSSDLEDIESDIGGGDDELEAKFAELEREMNQEND